MSKADNEQNLGAAELNSRLTNPEFLIEAGAKFIADNDEEFFAIAEYYRDFGNVLPMNIERMGELLDGLDFLVGRLSILFPEYKQRLGDLNSFGQSHTVLHKKVETELFLKRAKAFADLTK
ncbi:MAG TPA: hypothetical protein VG895_04155 [Patescibacteria group bacterium]|nr:hypothetical protein [Patescibacteria group bacterium]